MSSAEITDSLINNVQVAKAEGVKMSVERTFILIFDEYVLDSHALVNANVEPKVTLKIKMALVREVIQSDRSINRSEYFVTITKLEQEEQRLIFLVESKKLELQTMPGFVEKVRLFGRAC